MSYLCFRWIFNRSQNYHTPSILQISCLAKCTIIWMPTCIEARSLFIQYSLFLRTDSFDLVSKILSKEFTLAQCFPNLFVDWGLNKATLITMGVTWKLLFNYPMTILQFSKSMHEGLQSYRTSSFAWNLKFTLNIKCFLKNTPWLKASAKADKPNVFNVTRMTLITN